MKHELLKLNQLNLIEDTNPDKSDVLSSFAMDDTLCMSAGESNESTIRFWVHRPTAVLGIPDSRCQISMKQSILFNESAT